MIIQELRMKNFGKFSHHNIELKEGINIIHGDNESGKTTTHQFIKSVLYGIPKNKTDDLGNNVYERYKPRNMDDKYKGSISIKNDDEVFLLERDFNNDRLELVCKNESSGYNVNVEKASELPWLDGLTESLYDISICSDSMNEYKGTKFINGVYNYVAKLITEKNKYIDMSAGLQDLEQKKKIIEENRTQRLLTEFEEEIERDEAELMQLDSLQKRAEELEVEINKSNDEKQLESVRIITEYVDNFDNIKKKYKDYQEVLDKKNLIQKIDDKVSESEETTKAKFPIIMISLDIICIFFIISLMGVNVGGILTSIGISFILGAILYLYNSKATELFIKRECKKELLYEQQSRKNLEQYNSKLIELQTEILEYAKRAYPLKELNDQEMCNLEQEVLVLKNQMEGYMHRQKQADEADKKELELVNNEILRLKNREEERQKRKDNYEKVKKELETEKDNYEALDITITTLKELVKEHTKSFIDELNPVMSKYCETITSGKFIKLQLDEEGNLSIANAYGEKDLYNISSGVIRQIYLSIRLATTKLFCKERYLPIILDEDFALLDDNRLKETLLSLSKLKERQIIILTCHNREAQILKEEGIAFNFVGL